MRATYNAITPDVASKSNKQQQQLRQEEGRVEQLWLQKMHSFQLLLLLDNHAAQMRCPSSSQKKKNISITSLSPVVHQGA